MCNNTVFSMVYNEHTLSEKNLFLIYMWIGSIFVYSYHCKLFLLVESVIWTISGHKQTNTELIHETDGNCHHFCAPPPDAPPPKKNVVLTLGGGVISTLVTGPLKKILLLCVFPSPIIYLCINHLCMYNLAFKFEIWEITYCAYE